MPALRDEKKLEETEAVRVPNSAAEEAPRRRPACAACRGSSARSGGFFSFSALRDAAGRPRLERCPTPGLTGGGRWLRWKAGPPAAARLREARAARAAAERPGAGHQPAAGRRAAPRLRRRSQLLCRPHREDKPRNPAPPRCRGHFPQLSSLTYRRIYADSATTQER